MQSFKRKKGGRYVPLTYQSREEIHEVSAKHVRDLQAQGMPFEQAINTVAGTYPDWYAADKGGPGSSLKRYMDNKAT
jgi:hypothetical protein